LKKKTKTYVDGNPVPGLGLVQKCIGSKLKNGITTPAFLIIGSTMTIQIKTNKKCLLGTKDQVKKKNKDWLTWSWYNVSDFRHGFCGLLFL
jgi:hypothetical protein